MTLKNTLTDILTHLPSWEQQRINEAQTRQVIILRILEQLGYNIWQPFEILAEETSSSNYRPDFVIKLQRNCFVIEAKALGKALSDADVEQAINYVNNKALRWAILTNGKEWKLLDNELRRVASERLAFSFQLQDSDAIEYFENLLGVTVWRQENAADFVADHIQVIKLYQKLDKEIRTNYTAVRSGLQKAIAKELSEAEQQFALQHFDKIAEMLHIDTDAIITQQVAITSFIPSQIGESEILQRLAHKIDAVVRTVERRKLVGFSVTLGTGTSTARHWRDLHTALAELLIDLYRESELTLVEAAARNLETYDSAAYCLLSNGRYLLTHFSTRDHLKYINHFLKQLSVPSQQLQIDCKQVTYLLPE
jgi:predicted type IV restriction endonuclease